MTATMPADFTADPVCAAAPSLHLVPSTELVSEPASAVDQQQVPCGRGWDPSSGLLSSVELGDSSPPPFVFWNIASGTGPDSLSILSPQATSPSSDFFLVPPAPTFRDSSPNLHPHVFAGCHPSPSDHTAQSPLSATSFSSRLSLTEPWQMVVHRPFINDATFYPPVPQPHLPSPNTLPSSKPQSDQDDHAAENLLDHPKPPKRKRGRPRTYPDVDPNEPFTTLTRLPRSSYASPNHRAGTGAGTSSNIFVLPRHHPHSSGGSTLTGEGDKSPKRQRNRAAATRYRHRVQSQIKTLEEEVEAVANERQSLVVCLEKLREEAYILKLELMRHANCDCPLIQDRLSRDIESLRGQFRERTGGVGLVC